MSAAAKIGLDAVLTIDGAQIKKIKVPAVNPEKSEADVPTRERRKWIGGQLAKRPPSPLIQPLGIVAVPAGLVASALSEAREIE